jgi:hypothetical protein
MAERKIRLTSGSSRGASRRAQTRLAARMLFTLWRALPATAPDLTAGRQVH